MKFQYRAYGFEGVLHEADSDYACICVIDHNANSKRSLAFARWLNDKGIAALCLSLYGTRQTPPDPCKIPVDFAVLAYRCLKERGYHHIGIIGASLGASYALVAATCMPLSCVIALSPQDVVYEAVDGRGHALGESQFSYQARALPFALLGEEGSLPERYDEGWQQALEEAFIACERITGRILVVSGVMDEVYGSREACKRIGKRLQAHQFAHGFKHISYRYGTHDLMVTGVPSSRLSPFTQAAVMPRQQRHVKADLTKSLQAYLESWRQA